MQQLKLPFLNLEKEGLILESRNIPEKRLVFESEITSMSYLNSHLYLEVSGGQFNCIMSFLSGGSLLELEWHC